MHKLIQLNSIEYLSATTFAQLAANSLNTELNTWSSLGEKSTALESFAEQYVEMEKTMKLFQSLLQADLDLMSDIGKELLMTDLKLTSIWK